MVNDDFGAACTLFPGNEYIVETNNGSYKVTCEFGDSMRIEKT
jgi:hypothetical protein